MYRVNINRTMLGTCTVSTKLYYLYGWVSEEQLKLTEVGVINTTRTIVV